MPRSRIVSVDPEFPRESSRNCCTVLRADFMAAVTCDGPLFIRCRGYALFLLPTAVGRALPDDAERAWNELPPRRVVPARFGLVKTPRPQLEPEERTEPPGTYTSVRYRPGPRALHGDLVQPGEHPIGTLHIEGQLGSASLSLGATALGEGVLLGRYSRCDTAELFDKRVSRVHALIIDVDSAVYAVDCASMNRLVVRGEERRVIELGPSLSMTLGATRVDWRPLH